MIENSNVAFPAGSVILFTSGYYDEFAINSLLVTIKPCNMRKLMNEYVKSAPPRYDNSYMPNVDDFPVWLITNNYAVELNSSEIRLGEDEIPCEGLMCSAEYRQIKLSREADFKIKNTEKEENSD